MQPKASMAPQPPSQTREPQTPLVFPAAAAILMAASTEGERPPTSRGTTGDAAAAILLEGGREWGGAPAEPWRVGAGGSGTAPVLLPEGEVREIEGVQPLGWAPPAPGLACGQGDAES